jgi:hypothetical protein
MEPKSQPNSITVVCHDGQDAVTPPGSGDKCQGLKKSVMRPQQTNKPLILFSIQPANQNSTIPH